MIPRPGLHYLAARNVGPESRREIEDMATTVGVTVSWHDGAGIVSRFEVGRLLNVGDWFLVSQDTGFVTIVDHEAVEREFMFTD